MALPRKLVVDECPDAFGFWTVRVDDGTPNGDIEEKPIATFYNLELANVMVAAYNHAFKYMR